MVREKNGPNIEKQKSLVRELVNLLEEEERNSKQRVLQSLNAVYTLIFASLIWHIYDDKKVYFVRITKDVIKTLW